jgi:DNA-binding MarR family transcriptional regulator
MRKPIGYWLKQVDTLLEDAVAAGLAEQGVSRREWQVLNVLATADGGDPRAALAPFDGVEQALARLSERGWVAGERLTEAGGRAHAQVAEHIGQVRRRAVEGVSLLEYEATVDVLRRMAANLSPAG